MTQQIEVRLVVSRSNIFQRKATPPFIFREHSLKTSFSFPARWGNIIFKRGGGIIFYENKNPGDFKMVSTFNRELLTFPFYKVKAEAEQDYRNSMPASSYQQQKLRVCEVRRKIG